MLTQHKDRTPQGELKLHTIHALLRGRNFQGQFEARGKTYSFNFLPAEASIVEQTLLLSGRLTVKSPQLGLRFADGVKARLVATQGGVGVSPVRRQLLTGTAQTAQTATSEQKMEQERSPETELQPGLHAFEPLKFDELGRPNVEGTGSLGFVGVLYFHLSPLEGRALGVPLDLRRVQLGGRMAPTDDVARDLQLLFSDLVAALAAKQPDERAAKQSLDALNRIFKS
jgi:hypothetical protein